MVEQTPKMAPTQKAANGNFEAIIVCMSFINNSLSLFPSYLSISSRSSLNVWATNSLEWALFRQQNNCPWIRFEDFSNDDDDDDEDDGEY